MSLEESIVTLTNAVETMTAKLEQLTQTTEALRSLRADAIETVKNTAAAPTEKKTPARAAKEEIKEEPQKEEAQPETPAESDTDTLADTVKEYIGLAGDDADQRKKYAGKVKEIFGKVKATKRSEVPKEKEAAVEKAIRKLIEEAQPTENSDDDDDLL